MIPQIKPPQCTHMLYPKCGCVFPPVAASHLIVERDRKIKEEAERKKPVGRPFTPWKATPTEDEEFLSALPDALEDPYTRSKLLQLVDAELARADFVQFVRQAWHVVEPSTVLEWNWHHELICKVLQGMFEDWEHGQDDPEFISRVINCVLNVPPGSLKSRLLCVMFPVWCWLRRPGVKFICLSVNEEAAFRDARDARTLVRSDWFQRMFEPDWQIKDDQDAISNYGNSAGGIRLSKALGSEIVGLRGDLILLDDPNNPKESESKLVREGVNETWRTNVFNRVNGPNRSMRIAIQQRTHAEDWTGFVINPDNGPGVWSPENRLGWLLVVLPAEFEPDRKCVTPWGSDIRKVKGEPLHTARMTPEFLEAEKKRFGTQKYAGQMQQRPVLAEGGMVKMRFWRFWHDQNETPTPPNERPEDEMDKVHSSILIPRLIKQNNRRDLDWTVISIDAAAKKTERGSQHGIVVLGGKRQNRYVLDDRTKRGDILEVIAIIEDLCRIYEPNRLIIEAKAAGPSLMTLFEERFQKGKIRGSRGQLIPVIVDPIDPQGDKASRLDACLPEFEAGLVHLHDGADWVPAFIGEVCGYPLSTFDDRVDALSQALNHMRGFNGGQLPKW